MESTKTNSNTNELIYSLYEVLQNNNLRYNVPANKTGNGKIYDVHVNDGVITINQNGSSKNNFTIEVNDVRLDSVTYKLTTTSTKEGKVEIMTYDELIDRLTPANNIGDVNRDLKIIAEYIASLGFSASCVFNDSTRMYVDYNHLANLYQFYFETRLDNGEVLITEFKYDTKYQYFNIDADRAPVTGSPKFRLQASLNSTDTTDYIEASIPIGEAALNKTDIVHDAQGILSFIKSIAKGANIFEDPSLLDKHGLHVTYLDRSEKV